MRNAFAKELTAVAAEDERVVLLAGDIGNRLFDEFKARCPRRFYNCGVAEANMMSMAAGMALCGLRPVVYSIAPFVTARCFEQIRIDVCYQNVPVLIAGTGAGLSYASLNATHHSCEDIGILRLLPNMCIVCPGDSWEVQRGLRAALQHDGPVYLRLGKKGEHVVHTGGAWDFVIGRGLLIRSGTDLSILSTGNVLPMALQAADMLARGGLSAEVVSCHTVKPLDVELLTRVFSDFQMVVTVEEHTLAGGLGSAAAEWLADSPPRRARLCRIGLADRFLYQAGEQDHARAEYGLTAEAIVSRVAERYTVYRSAALQSTTSSLRCEPQ
jgi:transketolase